MTQLVFEFVGTTTEVVSLDAKEYRGMSTPQIAADLLRTLSEIAPGVNFFHDDVVLAADELREADDEQG